MTNSIALLIQEKVGKQRLFYFTLKVMRKAADTHNKKLSLISKFSLFFEL